MTYYQSDDNTTYEPSSRHITIGDHVYVGMYIRFSHPDYGFSGENCLQKLVLNEVYKVSDYMIYMDGITFTLSAMPGFQFDSKLFTLQNNNYIIPFGKRKIKFWWNKNKLRLTKWICSH